MGGSDGLKKAHRVKGIDRVERKGEASQCVCVRKRKRELLHELMYTKVNNLYRCCISKNDKEGHE